MHRSSEAVLWGGLLTPDPGGRLRGASEEHAAYGIGFRGDTPPLPGNCLGTLVSRGEPSWSEAFSEIRSLV
jgi:hypothetical protein